jgi:hypothetical protein
MKAETRFKLVVLTLVNLGIYPGPQAVRKALGRGWRSPRSASAECTGGRTLNGRETRWRRELLTGLGWKERPFGHRHARFAWVKGDDLCRFIRERICGACVYYRDLACWRSRNVENAVEYTDARAEKCGSFRAKEVADDE